MMIGQLTVAFRTMFRQEVRHDLLVGHRQHHVPVRPVLEARHLRPTRVVAGRSPARPPAGSTTGISISCPPIASSSSRIYLLHPLAHAMAERQQGVDAGPKLADVAGTQEQADETASPRRRGRRGAW